MLNRIVVVSSQVLRGGETARAWSLPSLVRSALRREQNTLWFGWAIGPRAASILRSSDVPSSGTEVFGVAPTAAQKAGLNLGLLPKGWPHFFGPSLAHPPQKLDYKLAYDNLLSDLVGQLAPMLGPSDRICAYGQNMIPVGRLLQRQNQSKPIGLLLTTSFPSLDHLFQFEWHHELALDLLAYDFIGFQSQADQTRFRAFIRNVDLARHGEIPMVDTAHPATGIVPVGIDAGAVMERATLAGAYGLVQTVEKILSNQTLIVELDSHGELQTHTACVQAYDHMLRARPDLGAASCLMRVDLEQTFPRGVSWEVIGPNKDPFGQAIQKSGFLGPIQSYKCGSGGIQTGQAAIFRYARVGLALSEGGDTNLAAREYVAAQDKQDPGVLVLSQTDPIASLLTDAILVDSKNPAECSNAIAAAITMSQDERRDRWQRMMVKLRHHDEAHWHNQFLGSFARSIHATRQGGPAPRTPRIAAHDTCGQP